MTGMDAAGSIIPHGEYSWQQGIMVGTFDPDNPGNETVELYTIKDGVCLFRGQEYRSELDVNHIHPAIAQRHELSV